MKSTSNIPTLTERQQLSILTLWKGKVKDGGDPPSIEEILSVAYPENEGLDGRTKEGRMVKQFLVEKGLGVTTKTHYIKKGLINLTIDQEEYIRNNPNMRSHEVAQIIFNDTGLSPTSRESRSVYELQKKLIKEGVLIKDEIIKDGNLAGYSSPKSLDRACQRVNRYIRESSLDSKNLSPTQRKQVNNVIAYLNDYRFIYQVNSFTKQVERDLFESSFLSYVYDKQDLTKEDVHKTILLACESVIANKKQRTIEALEAEQQRSLEETQRLSMPLVDAIKTTTDDYHKSIQRQQALMNDLTKKRSDRLKDKLNDKASVMNLVEMWKNEETRLKMLRLGDKRKEQLNEEIERLDSMDDIICMVAGLDKNEALNG